MARKLLIIGLDGASFVALDPLFRRGAMPTLARLRAEGFSATLQSTVPPVSAPAWATFITGKNPGKHGIFQFYDVNPWSAGSLGVGRRTYLAAPGVIVNGRSITEPKFWHLLSAAGRRVASINLPMSYPPEPINGLMVTGMLTPPGSRRFTHPPALVEELGDYEIDLNPEEKDFSSSDERFLSRMRDILLKRARAGLTLFQKESWDCFMIIFTETDRLQHRYWHYLDPAVDGLKSPDVEARLVDFFRLLDDCLSQFIRAADPEYDTIILSDHGFGPAASKRLNLSTLARVLNLEQGPSGLGTNILRSLKGLVPAKRRIYKVLGPVLSHKVLERAEAHVRERTLRGVKAKLVKLHDYIGGVWINPSALEKNGGVSHMTVDSYRTDIIERLAAIRDPATGERVVTEIMVREGVYRGPHTQSAPDVIFVLDESYGIETGPVSRKLICRIPQKNQGTHRTEGILIMSGGAIRPGTQVLSNGLTMAPPKLEDVTASLLYLSGIPLLDDMDGRVIEEAFDEAFLKQYPITFQSAPPLPSISRPVPWNSDEEEKLIRDRLKELGYLE